MATTGMDVDAPAPEANGGGEAPASCTLYVHNLAERPRKEELRKCLRVIFAQFGTVLDVVLSKAYKLRGQAWVVFSTPQEAAEAKALMEGFQLYEKPLRIEYAKTKSDAVAKADGSFEPRPSYDKAKRKAETKAAIKERRKAKEAAAAVAPPSIAAAPPPRVAPTIAAAPAPFAAAMPRPPYGGGFGHGLMDGPSAPHKILFVQNLPETVARTLLVSIFSQLPGFREVRTVESRPGIAFVEYADEGLAGAALAAFQGFQVGEEHINLSFARL